MVARQQGVGDGCQLVGQVTAFRAALGHAILTLTVVLVAPVLGVGVGLALWLLPTDEAQKIKETIREYL